MATTGLSVGGIAVTPFVAAAVESRGLAATAPTLAVALLLGVVPVTLLLVRAPPRGPRAAGNTGTAATDARGVVATRYWRTVTGVHALAMLAQVGMLVQVHEVVLGRTDAGTAAAAVSTVAAASLVGRLVAGVVVAGLPLRGLYGGLLVVQAAALLLMSRADSDAALLVSAALFGATVGTVLMLHPLLLVERFGPAGAGRAYATSQLLATLGIAAGTVSCWAPSPTPRATRWRCRWPLRRASRPSPC